MWKWKRCLGRKEVATRNEYRVRKGRWVSEGVRQKKNRREEEHKARYCVKNGRKINEVKAGFGPGWGHGGQAYSGNCAELTRKRRATLKSSVKTGADRRTGW